MEGVEDGWLAKESEMHTAHLQPSLPAPLPHAHSTSPQNKAAPFAPASASATGAKRESPSSTQTARSWRAVLGSHWGCSAGRTQRKASKLLSTSAAAVVFSALRR